MVNPAGPAVKLPKPPRPTSSLSATASSTNSHLSSAPMQQTSYPRAKSYPTPAQPHSTTLPPQYGQRLLQDDISIGGYNSSNDYAQPPLSTLGTNGFTVIPSTHGEWSNQYAHGGWETHRNHSRRLPQGSSSEYWYEQGSRVSRGRSGIPGIGVFTPSPTLPHHGTGNLRSIPTGPRAERGLQYPSNSTTTMDPIAVYPNVQYSLPMGVGMSQEIPPQIPASHGFHTSPPSQPISTQSQFPNQQGPVPPPAQHSALKMDLPLAQMREPSNTRLDVASEENASQGHLHSEPTDSSNTLPTPVTPSVLQLPPPRPPSPPKGPVLPTIDDILSPVPEPYKRNMFSRMQEVEFDSSDLASVLSEAESDGRPVVVRNFPLCAWWENTPLNPRNLQKVLERPSQPCTGAIPTF